MDRQQKMTDFFQLSNKHYKKREEEKATSPTKSNHVMLPHHYKKSWYTIKKLLQDIVLNNAIHCTADFLEILQQIICANYIVKTRSHVCLKGLCSFLHWLGQESEYFFLKEILPFICIMALKSKELFKSTDIPILIENKANQVCLSREQVGCIMSLCFLCAMPVQKDNTTPGQPNFYDMFKSQGKVINNKLLFMVNYFTSLKHDSSHINDLLCFNRLCMDSYKFKGLNWEYWSNSQSKMTPVIIVDKGRLEDENESYCVDFANKYIGGGAMTYGAVQEEILFIIMPELFFSRVITEKLNDNEALVIEGLAKFSEYSGYSSDLKYAGDCIDSKTKYHRKVIAIDAIPFSSNRDRFTQFHKHIMLRELNKCHVGFKVNGQIATGRWGCGAFNGNAQLKFVLQWIAASQNNLPLLSFYSYEDKNLLNLKEVIKALDNLRVGELCALLLKFEAYFFDSLLKDHRTEEIEKKFDNVLFEYILRKSTK